MTAHTDHPARPRALALFSEVTADAAERAAYLLTGRGFVELDAPACGVVLDVPAEVTHDATARRFVCDRIATHLAEGIETHRQATDVAAGSCMEWPADAPAVIAAALAEKAAAAAAD